VKKVAVFGNAGGGKSTLARRRAEMTHLPLYPVDMIQYRAGGGEVPHDEYLKAHAELLQRDAWIIDGFGCVTSAWERFASADTLVYIDQPLFTHFLWVTKRLLKGLVCNSERVARGQSHAQEHDQQLSCALALSPASDAQVQSARVCGSPAQARPSPEVGGRDGCVPERGEAGDPAARMKAT
jgi:hypothetical protein